MALFTCCTALDILLALSAVCGLIYVYATWNYGYWKKKGIPYMKGPFPLLGSLKRSTLGHISVSEDYHDIYRQLKPYKVGGFFKFRDPSLMVCDPELVKTFSVREFSHFHDNDIDVTIEDDPTFGRNPFCLRGERWKTVRSQMTPAFTPAKIKPFYFPLIKDVCAEMEEYILKHTEELEAKELAAKFTTDVVASCAFGMNGNSFTDPDAIFRKMGRDIMSGDWLHNIKWTFVFLVPKLAKLFKFRIFNEKVVAYCRGAIAEAIEQRERSQLKRNDFLQLMIQLKNKGAVNGEDNFTDEDIAAQAFVFYTDGFETSSTALGLALFELAMNPEVQERLRREVDEGLELQGGEITYDLIQEVSYLDMVLSETMRKYPPLGFFNRMCTKPYSLTLPDGKDVLIEEGTSITFSILGIQNDPEYFPDPERFDPERFSEEEKASRHSHAYLPFGAGPRSCLGTRFAMTQMKAGLASIISKFEIRLSNRTPWPLQIDPAFLVTAVKGGLWVKFVRRTDK